MKIIILGSGFVGNHVYNFYHSKNMNVSIYSRKKIDYHNLSILEAFLKHEKPDFIINCSGYTGSPNVDSCEDNKLQCAALNIEVPTIISAVCEKLNIKVIHVSSGCIYTGYDRLYSEIDIPNFGLYNNESSYYSKTKHIFELSTKAFQNTTILRIRMPFTNTLENKNYLYKIFKYDNLISQKNSLTYINDLINFLTHLMFRRYSNGIINVVNPQPFTAEEIVELFRKNDLVNPNWKFVEFSTLNTKANRSNCILSTDKITNLGFTFSDTFESVENCIKDLKIALSK